MDLLTGGCGCHGSRALAPGLRRRLGRRRRASAGSRVAGPLPCRVAIHVRIAWLALLVRRREAHSGILPAWRGALRQFRALGTLVVRRRTCRAGAGVSIVVTECVEVGAVPLQVGDAHGGWVLADVIVEAHMIIRTARSASRVVVKVMVMVVPHALRLDEATVVLALTRRKPGVSPLCNADEGLASCGRRRPRAIPRQVEGPPGGPGAAPAAILYRHAVALRHA